MHKDLTNNGHFCLSYSKANEQRYRIWRDVVKGNAAASLPPIELTASQVNPVFLAVLEFPFICDVIAHGKFRLNEDLG